MDDMEHLTVLFAEHLGPDRIASLVSAIAAYGDVFPGPKAHVYQVTVWRKSHIRKLQEHLVSLEKRGVLRWQDHATG